MPPINAPRDLAAAARGRRLELGLSQAELARRAGISRTWINEFERGKPTAELQIVLRLLDALDLHLEVDTRDRAQVADAGRADLDALLDEHLRE